MTPAPLMSTPANSEDVLMVKGLASGWKTMLSSVMPLETLTFVWFETPKVATSEGPFGTVAGFQLAAVFQSPVAGVCCHVALPAKTRPALPQNRARVAIVAKRNG